MGLENLIILTKLEELDAYSHKAVIGFPKYEKFVPANILSETILRRLT